MTLDEQIQLLESMVLLGPAKQEAMDFADRLALELDPNDRPDVALRLLIRRFMAMPRTANALAQLATAEAWASSEGETALALQLQLLWCRHVALTDPDVVPRAVLDEAIENAQKSNTFHAEWRLAMAAVERKNGLVLREQALTFLTEPGTEHDQLQVHLELADDRLNGSDSRGALQHLLKAHELATAHQDPAQLSTCATRLGLYQIDRGTPNMAQPYLEEALALARSQDDDLQIVPLATFLSTIYLGTDDDDNAAKMGDLLLVSGARRANWFAVVDGHIVRSSLSLKLGDTTGAIDRLVRAILRLRELVPGAAINLLKGRLAELRHELGAAVFDEHYQRAIKANEEL